MLRRLGLVMWMCSAIYNVNITIRDAQPDLPGAIILLIMWLLGAALFICAN